MKVFAIKYIIYDSFLTLPQTDHPVVNGRDLLFEAQQAHYFGLPAHLALASITSVPATAAGLSHRVGILKKGSDADIVLWDSHPLRLGATPRTVWIDGQRVLPAKNTSHTEVGLEKVGSKWLVAPTSPNWDKERDATIKHEGLPPLGAHTKLEGKVVFKRVKEVWLRSAAGVQKYATTSSGTVLDGSSHDNFITAVTFRGRLLCAETGLNACKDQMERDIQIVDLAGGSILPALMTYGSPLGLEEIAGEPSTGGGLVLDPLKFDVPSIVGDAGAAMRAVDVLVFSTHNALQVTPRWISFSGTDMAHQNRPPIWCNACNDFAWSNQPFRRTQYDLRWSFDYFPNRRSACSRAKLCLARCHCSACCY